APQFSSSSSRSRHASRRHGARRASIPSRRCGTNNGRNSGFHNLVIAYLVVVTAFTGTPEGLVAGGSAPYVGSLVITTSQGTLTANTLGVAVEITVPGPLPELHAFAPFAETLAVTGGTGRFAGATGRLFMTGMPSTAANVNGGLVIS